MNDKSCRGFTLIEMAIVIMIIGLLVASLTPLYTRYQETKQNQATQAHINTAISAIGSFRSLYGRYPCPASLTATRTSEDYGREECDLTDVATNSTENGFYVEESVRAGINFQYPSGTVHNGEKPRIIVGTIPFRHLNLDEDRAYDGYDNRLMYVVTEHLTCANCFEPSQGGIDIVNDSDDSVLPTPGTAHFMVFSYGKNAAGAFNKSGNGIDCAANGIESENCDFTAGNFDATYQIAAASTSGTARNYDDVVDYFTQDEIPLWQMSTDPDAGRQDIHQKAGGDVAIMMPASDITQPGDIGGTVRAASGEDDNPPTGQVIASDLCTSGDVGCFSPLVIAGKIAEGNGLKCPEGDTIGSTGKFMVAIKNGQPVCSDTVEDRCDTGEFATGINASGEIVCSQVSGCPAQQVQLCNISFTLAAGVEGTTRTITAGNSGRLVYTCTDGQWVAQGSMTGSCVCTPQDRTTTASCPTGYTGSRVQRVVRICPSGRTTTTILSDNCTCVDNYRQTQTRSCPSGYTGSIPQERFFRCGATPSWSAWRDVHANPVATNCRCTDRTETRYRACGANQTGSIEERRTIRCTGSGVEVGEWTSVGGGNDCKPKVCKWKTSSSPQLSPFKSGKEMTSKCDCGESGKCYSFASAGLYNNYQVCRCE